MPVVTKLDGVGNPIRYIEVHGSLYPVALNEETIRNIKNFNIRQDDIIICGYQRSGSHWMWEMTSMLLKGKVETLPMEREVGMLEYTAHAQIDGLPSPRVLGSHMKYEDLPPGIRLNRIKIIYLMRNPRDVAVSWYTLLNQFEDNGYEGSWEDWFPLFLQGNVDWGSWFDHVRSWECTFNSKCKNEILILHYEDIKADPILAVQKISDFLVLHRNNSLCSAIAEKCSFENMKKDKMSYTALPRGKPVHYRKGMVGDWKNIFTVAQSELFERLYENKMEGSVFKTKYSLSV